MSTRWERFLAGERRRAEELGPTWGMWPNDERPAPRAPAVGPDLDTRRIDGARFLDEQRALAAAIDNEPHDLEAAAERVLGHWPAGTGTIEDAIAAVRAGWTS